MAKQERIEQAAVCREIGARTGGDILIGVVGPVRTGKSTLIKQFMEKLVLPAIGPEDAKLRARDELPQSAAGRTIMTTEPKFIPESAVPLALEGGGECSIRLIDCVGYMVEGAMGHEENDKPRMVKSPWFDEEIPFDLAAETGTRKVIRDHSTIGIVVTTDGTISEIPRENYIPAEKRVIDELSLEQPEIVRQGGRYGVRLEASAPSIHMMKAVIHTELSPIVGTEKQSEDLVQSLLKDFEDDPVRLWESNIFGKSLHELVNDGLQNKLLHMPQEARGRLQETLERVINEGCTGLICILI